MPCFLHQGQLLAGQRPVVALLTKSGAQRQVTDAIQQTEWNTGFRHCPLTIEPKGLSVDNAGVLDYRRVTIGAVHPDNWGRPVGYHSRASHRFFRWPDRADVRRTFERRNHGFARIGRDVGTADRNGRPLGKGRIYHSDRHGDDEKDEFHDALPSIWHRCARFMLKNLPSTIAVKKGKILLSFSSRRVVASFIHTRVMTSVDEAGYFFTKLGF